MHVTLFTDRETNSMLAEKRRTCLDGLRAQFSIRKLKLHHDNPALFVNAQCFKPWVYLIWSGFWALFFFSMLMLDAYYNRNIGAKYFVFLTNLTYLLQTSSVLLDFTVTLYVYRHRRDIRDGDYNQMEWYMKVQWVLFNITSTSSLLVTIMYYTLLTPVFTHGSINTHLLNSVHTLLNILFCAKPVQILHIYQPLIYGLVYLIFSVIYHLAGADPIYDPLDWSKSGRTSLISLLALFVAIPFVNVFIVFLLYSVRLWVHKNCCNSRVSAQPEVSYGAMNFGLSRSDSDLTKSKY